MLLQSSAYPDLSSIPFANQLQLSLLLISAPFSTSFSSATYPRAVLLSIDVLIVTRSWNDRSAVITLCLCLFEQSLPHFGVKELSTQSALYVGIFNSRFTERKSLKVLVENLDLTDSLINGRYEDTSLPP